MLKKVFRIFFFITILVITVSCRNDGYDAGEGKYSNLYSDFGDITTKTGGQLNTFYRDDDLKLTFDASSAIPEAKADTTYRALLHYKPVGDRTISLVGLEPVMVIRPFVPTPNTYYKHDPVELISAWKSKNGQYINLALGLKVGQPDTDNKKHILGGMLEREYGTTNSYSITLLHDQNGVPENYTTTAYVSFPLKGLFVSGDKVRIAVYIGDGYQLKDFVVP